MKLIKLLKKIKTYNPEADFDLIRKAYDYASKLHEKGKRTSGEPYIEHPLHVAYILAELKFDTASIIASLLHDTIEDTPASLNDIKEKFGEEITMLVDGVTKLKEIKYLEERNVKFIRKMLIASTKDIRVIIIKLADKLHNMRTISYLSSKKIQRICQETLDVYAPLAHKLGMFSIKSELEDLSFKHLHPDMYKKFKEKFGKKRTEREREIKRIRTIIERKLKENHLNAKILSRPKSFYSVYKKMIKKKRSFEEIYDLIGFRIVTDTIKDCYDLLGMIHQTWKPIPKEFDDYIALPKPNMYQSLHTSVLSRNEPIEFQIRTYEMDRTAEEGIAAHWSYKGIKDDEDFNKKTMWLKKILAWQQESTDVNEFIEYLKEDFFEDEIYVFTPKEDVINLPKGSSPIDFAYAVHTYIGDRCNGVIVNGRIVPLRHQLENGDIVQILTSKNPNPRKDWLKIVKTGKAKTLIKNHFKLPEDSLDLIKERKPKKSTIVSLISVNKKPTKKYKLAKGCNPIPGDKIFALENKGRYIIHKIGCKVISLTNNKEMINASWNDIHSLINFRILTDGRKGMLSDMINTITGTRTIINSYARAQLKKDDKLDINFDFTAEGLDHTIDLINKIKKLKGVLEIKIV
tara:strand:+ start:34142 stop:36031 length:1890 start_codon:yes stop_codon:yes gene_type:complete